MEETTPAEHACEGANCCADVPREVAGAPTESAPDRDRHFANPPLGGLHLDGDQLASLKVLLDNAVPREPGSPTDWEGAGRRYHESVLGFRSPCTCAQPRLVGDRPAAGCPVHDPETLAEPADDTAQET